MDVKDLIRFVKVAQDGHLTDSAFSLHVTEPTLSRSISRLERQLGIKLFERKNNRLMLNEAGQIFLNHANKVLAELDFAQVRIQDLVTPTDNYISIAHSVSLGCWIVQNYISTFHATNPTVRFSLQQGPTDVIASLLEAGHVDFVFDAGRPSSPNIEWSTLRMERLYVLAPSHHHISHVKSLDLSDIAGEPFIICSEPSLRELTHALCASAGFVPLVISESSDLDVIRNLVSSGLGLAIIPRSHVGSKLAAMTYVEIEDSLGFREMGVAWNRTAEPNSTVDHFRDHVLAYELTRPY